MTQAVILHSIKDVTHCLKYGFHKNSKLFSANVHVVYYLKHHYSLECEDLSSFINVHEHIHLQSVSLKISQTLLKELDEKNASKLNQQMGLSVRYFEPLYSFTSALQLFVYMSLHRYLNEMMTRFYLETILVYDGVLGPLNGDIRSFLNSLYPECTFQIIQYLDRDDFSGVVFDGFEIGNIPDIISQDEIRQISKQEKNDKENILVFEPLDKLQFLVQEFHIANVYSVNHGGMPILNQVEYYLDCNVLPEGEFLEVISSATEESKPLLLMLYDLIRYHFCRNIIQHLRRLHPYKEFHEAESICTVFWESPPLRGAEALLLEYFISNGTTRLIGIQSRVTTFVGQIIGVYTNINIFNRCQYFIAQGITNEDIDYLYHKKKCIIIPVQNRLLNLQAKSNMPLKVSIDVAFFLKPTLPFLATGHVSSYVITQDIILNFLNSVSAKNIHVVIEEDSSYDNCAVFSLLNVLKNVTVIKANKFENYLLEYSPKLVLMDSPSPVLIDVLCKNIEDMIVILVDDPLMNFNDKVLFDLKEEVYYASDAEEAVQLLKKYFSGLLKIKINSGEYLHRFCNQVSVKEKILQYYLTE